MPLKGRYNYCLHFTEKMGFRKAFNSAKVTQPERSRAGASHSSRLNSKPSCVTTELCTRQYWFFWAKWRAEFGPIKTVIERLCLECSIYKSRRWNSWASTYAGAVLRNEQSSVSLTSQSLGRKTHHHVSMWTCSSRSCCSEQVWSKESSLDRKTGGLDKTWWEWLVSAPWYLGLHLGWLEG